jgi:hypothetical protein
MDNDLLLPLLTTSVASSCKLPEYWPDAPALWFLWAECSFLLRNLTEQREKFCPGGAVLAEGLHAPGGRPGGVAAGRAYVQRYEESAVSFSPAH